MKRAFVVSAAATAVVLAPLALAGCGVVSSFPPPQHLPDDVIAAARASDGAPHDVDGGSRASCGEIRLDQGETVPADATACMNAAIGTADAELVVVAPTTEGDPIITFYRTAAGAPGIATFSDAEFDRYGGGSAWTHEDHPDVTHITALPGYRG